MKKQIVPIIAVGLCLVIIIPLIILSRKTDVSGTYQAVDDESTEFMEMRQEAVAYGANKIFDKAIESYEKALEMRPDNAEVHNDLGSVYHDLGLKYAGPTWPTWEADLTNMSMQDVIDEVEFAISDTDSGIIVFEAKDKKVVKKVVELAHKSKCWTHVEGNAINIMKGKTMDTLIKAKDHFLQATIIKSDYATAFRNLGALYYRIGQRKAGLQKMRQALDLNPNDERLKTYIEQFESTDRIIFTE